MVNLIKVSKKEEELKGMEVASFHEFGHRSIAAHLSGITENYFLFCQDFFLQTTKKIINQSYIPKYPINYQNKKCYSSTFVDLDHNIYQNKRLKIALGKKMQLSRFHHRLYTQRLQYFYHLKYAIMNKMSCPLLMKVKMQSFLKICTRMSSVCYSYVALI